MKINFVRASLAGGTIIFVIDLLAILTNCSCPFVSSPSPGQLCYPDNARAFSKFLELLHPLALYLNANVKNVLSCGYVTHWHPTLYSVLLARALCAVESFSYGMIIGLAVYSICFFSAWLCSGAALLKKAILGGIIFLIADIIAFITLRDCRYFCSANEREIVHGALHYMHPASRWLNDNVAIVFNQVEPTYLASISLTSLVYAKVLCAMEFTIYGALLGLTIALIARCLTQATKNANHT